MDTGFTNCCASGDTVVKDTAGNALTAIKAAKSINTIYELGQVAYYSNAILSGSSVVTTVGPEVAEAIGTAVQAGDVMAGFQSYAASTMFTPGAIAVMAAFYVAQELLSGGCDQEDIETAMLNSSGYCHYVGSYCARKIFLIGCVQRAKGYCCFNSKLARLIHEGGRPQLASFQPGGDWGSGDAQNCRGFTAEEFQMLDFSKIDLSSYFGELQTEAQSTIEQGVRGKISDFYNATQNKGK
jgi:conjugal transfer mating pair stabilization protein TraN